MKTETSRKIVWISFLMSLGVLMQHAYNVSVYSLSSSSNVFLFENFWTDFFQRSCVSIFFLMSGFLFFRNFDMSKLLKKYVSRFKTLLVPYIAWNTLYYLFFALVTRIPQIGRVMNMEMIDLSLSSYLNYIWQGYNVFWFIRVLIALVVCTPFIYVLLKNRKYYRAEVVVVAGIILLSIAQIRGETVSTWIYYWLGAYIGLNYPNIMELTNQKMTMFAVLATVVIVCFLPRIIFIDCVLYVAIWLAMDLFKYKKEVPWWVSCSFFYYCCHSLLLESVEKIILVIGGVSDIMALVDYLLAPVITFGLIVLAAYVLRKYMLPVWNVLTGNRGNVGRATTEKVR